MCAKRAKTKKYRKHTLNFELLVEKNKREIMRNEEQMEQIYIKIDEKHAGFDKDEGEKMEDKNNGTRAVGIQHVIRVRVRECRRRTVICGG